MVERMRRLRMSLASSSPGALGDTARPNYMGPSGNGLVGADERGGKPAESRAYRMGAPVRFQKAVSRSKEKRRSGAPRDERPASLGVRRKAQLPTVASFGAPLPSPLVRGSPLVSEGNGNSGAPRALRKQGRRSCDFFRAGCLECASDVHARARFGGTNPRFVAATSAARIS